MDRAFVYGRMYRSSMRYDKGICTGKQMIACVSTGASEASCSHSNQESDSDLHIWPILLPFRYLGCEVLEPEIFHGVGGFAFVERHEGGLSTPDTNSHQRETALTTLSSRPSVDYSRNDQFDETKRLIPGAPSIRRSCDTKETTCPAACRVSGVVRRTFSFCSSRRNHCACLRL